MYDRILCDVPCSGDGTLRKDLKVCSQLKHVAARTNAPTHPSNTPEPYTCRDTICHAYGGATTFLKVPTLNYSVYGVRVPASV